MLSTPATYISCEIGGSAGRGKLECLSICRARVSALTLVAGVHGSSNI